MSHRFRQPIFSFGNQPQASEPYAGGSQTTNSIFDLDSSLAAPSSPPPLPPSLNPPSTSRDSLLAKNDQSKWPDWPDYSVWTPELYKHFPNYTSAHNRSKESAWWWRFGYRLRTTEDPKLPWKIVWICHRQCEPGTKTQLKRHIEQGIAAYVQINRHDPVQQALIGRVDNFFCYRTTSLLVLDCTSFIGVNVYFIDRDWKQWTFLLGLPPVGGRHRGIDIAKDIIAILEDFGLSKYFPAIENLLDHLELAMDGEIVEDIVGDDGRKMLAMVPIFDGLDNATIRLIKVYLRLAWSKLDSYYQRMTSLAYYAAVILHPCRKMAHLELLWKELPSRQSTQWVDDVLQRMRKMWEDIYANRELPQRDNVQREEERDLDFVTSRAVFLQKRKQGQNTLTSGPEAQQKRRKNARVTRHQAPVVDPIVEDELTRYLAESVCTLPVYVMDPIRWWREVGVLQYPRLSYMATDMLTIPSSTAETERQFNRTNRIITPLRLRLRRQAVGWAQSIASWSTAGVYTPQIPLHLLNGDEWEGLVRDTIFDGLDL
ncbi:Ribonuclease H-like protein [Apiospora arundinis]